MYENTKFRRKSDEEAIVITSRYDAFSTAGMFIAFPAGSLFVSSGIVPYFDALGLVFVATGLYIISAGITVLFVSEGPRCPAPVGERALRHAYEGFTFVFKNKKRTLPVVAHSWYFICAAVPFSAFHAGRVYHHLRHHDAALFPGTTFNDTHEYTNSK